MNEIEDSRLEEELIHNEKENAEHLMLLDLGRNDIGKVAIGGSVKVTQEKVIEKYAKVMHLVSEVEGIMDLQTHKKDDALLAAFPAGTVSGAPKIQAIKTIESLEEHKRGIQSSTQKISRSTEMYSSALGGQSKRNLLPGRKRRALVPV